MSRSLKLAAIVAIVLGLVGGVWYLVEEAGYSKYRQFGKSIRSISDSVKRDDILENFWKDSEKSTNQRVEGGLIALVGKKGLWTWSRSGKPNYYRWTSNVVYGIVRNCTVESLVRAEKRGQSGETKMDTYKTVEEWKNEVKPGMHVYIFVGEGNKVGEITANPDIKTAGFLPIFCMKNLGDVNWSLSGGGDK